jgi:hypothetical protein
MVKFIQILFLFYLVIVIVLQQRGNNLLFAQNPFPTYQIKDKIVAFFLEHKMIKIAFQIFPKV